MHNLRPILGKALDKGDKSVDGDGDDEDDEPGRDDLACFVLFDYAAALPSPHAACDSGQKEPSRPQSREVNRQYPG